MPKTALITGITGQDGAYLARHLLNQGYTVWGGGRRSSQDNQWRLRELEILGDIHLFDLDLMEISNIMQALRTIEPDEVYNLAAQSFVAVSFEQSIYTSHVNAIGVAYILEAIRLTNPSVKFYQASTSEMFGNNNDVFKSEHTPFQPESPYATSKLYSHWLSVNYRNAYDIFACSGILFNHESPLRGLEFVTRKITRGFAQIKANKLKHIELGNLNARRDWGHAEDYTKGMYLMLQHSDPDDYVLSTGEEHSVREFVTHAAIACGWKPKWVGEAVDEVCLDEATGKELVKINPNLFRPVDVNFLRGDASKAREVLGWKTQWNFEDLVVQMMEEDLRRPL